MDNKHEKIGSILGFILIALVLICATFGCKTAKPNPEHDKIIEVLPLQKPLPPCK